MRERMRGWKGDEQDASRNAVKGRTKSTKGSQTERV